MLFVTAASTETLNGPNLGVNIYIYIYIHTYTHMYTHINTILSLSLYIYIYIYVYTYISIYMFILYYIILYYIISYIYIYIYILLRGATHKLQQQSDRLVNTTSLWSFIIQSRNLHAGKVWLYEVAYNKSCAGWLNVVGGVDHHVRKVVVVLVPLFVDPLLNYVQNQSWWAARKQQ